MRSKKKKSLVNFFLWARHGMTYGMTQVRVNKKKIEHEIYSGHGTTRWPLAISN